MSNKKPNSLRSAPNTGPGPGVPFDDSEFDSKSGNPTSFVGKDIRKPASLRGAPKTTEPVNPGSSYLSRRQHSLMRKDAKPKNRKKGPYPK
jgi:hypothetical protein